MRKSKFTDEQVIGFIKEVETGVSIAELCRRIGVTATTFHRWRSKFEGMDVSEAKRLCQLEDENRRLKQLVAEQSLDIQALKLVASKKW
jgi:putative transposase